MPSEHARLNPSAAERWLNCPGSVALSEQCPPAPSSEYAEEGTRAHAVAEAKLRNLSKEISTKKMNSLIAAQKPNGEMEEATDYYCSAVTEIYYNAGDDAELLVEQKFSLDKWVPESFGTSDAVVIGDGKIEVIDLKYGKGVPVSAKNNPQLRLYGLGASEFFGGLYDFDKVRMTIIQPRLDRISTEELPLSDLLAWADSIKPIAQSADDGTGKIEAGEWCRWCPAGAICRKRTDRQMELERLKFEDPALLTKEEIGEVLEKAEHLKAWCKDVEDYVFQQSLAGEHFDGWKLVEGRSNRKIVSEKDAVEKLKAAGFDEAMLYDRKLITLTAMEKLVGKKKLTETLGDTIQKPPGKPTLVPESDKREPINTAEKVAEDFKED